MIDRTAPGLPMEIFSLAEDDADLTYHLRCEELWVEILEELCCEEYLTRSHHNVGTYDQGCRGPLCRKALREHPRRKAQSISAYQLREERIYDPALEYFHTVAKYRIRVQQKTILQDLRETGT